MYGAYIRRKVGIKKHPSTSPARTARNHIIFTTHDAQIFATHQRNHMQPSRARICHITSACTLTHESWSHHQREPHHRRGQRQPHFLPQQPTCGRMHSCHGLGGDFHDNDVGRRGGLIMTRSVLTGARRACMQLCTRQQEQIRQRDHDNNH